MEGSAPATDARILERWATMAERDEAGECTRQLIHVPILHSSADMGTMAAAMEAAYIARFGRRHWREYLVHLEKFWGTVRAELGQLDLDYTRVDLYQDGLPVCGREIELVRAIAAMGSENHQLLLELVRQGATLVGTEDPGLLLTEYRDLKASLGNRTDEAGRPQASPEPSGRRVTLSQRDSYIGWRIGRTLHPGRTGILFLGMMHNVEADLPRDIVVSRLAPKVCGYEKRT